MKERPILFSAPMVKALLADTRTQTRRLAKFKAIEPGFNLRFSGVSTGHYCTGVPSSGHVLYSRRAGGVWEQRTKPLHCPFGEPGDRLWVRETWAPCEAPIFLGHTQFFADGAVGRRISTNGGEEWWARSGHTLGVSESHLHGKWVSKPSKWRPSIHMPRKVSRIDLEVTGVRVERLQAISEADAKAEGAAHRIAPGGDLAGAFEHDDTPIGYRAHFEDLWESINGPGSWAENPWVWVVEFKRVTP